MGTTSSLSCGCAGSRKSKSHKPEQKHPTRKDNQGNKDIGESEPYIKAEKTDDDALTKLNIEANKVGKETFTGLNVGADKTGNNPSAQLDVVAEKAGNDILTGLNIGADKPGNDTLSESTNGNDKAANDTLTQSNVGADKAAVNDTLTQTNIGANKSGNDFLTQFNIGADKAGSDTFIQSNIGADKTGNNTLTQIKGLADKAGNDILTQAKVGTDKAGDDTFRQLDLWADKADNDTLTQINIGADRTEKDTFIESNIRSAKIDNASRTELDIGIENPIEKIVVKQTEHSCSSGKDLKYRTEDWEVSDKLARNVEIDSEANYIEATLNEAEKNIQIERDNNPKNQSFQRKVNGINYMNDNEQHIVEEAENASGKEFICTDTAENDNMANSSETKEISSVLVPFDEIKNDNMKVIMDKLGSDVGALSDASTDGAQICHFLSVEDSNYCTESTVTERDISDVHVKEVPHVSAQTNSMPENNVRRYEDIDGGVEMDTSEMDPITSLTKQQDAIFVKLSDLKTTLDQLSDKYCTEPISTSPAAGAPGLVSMTTTKCAASPIKQSSGVVLKSPVGNGIHDVVISADPSRPPLSLFVLFELLKKKFKVLATSYVHSSVSGVDPALTQAFTAGSQVTRGAHQVALSVVWKKVANGPHLMISPTKQSVVSGEVNVARYVYRLLDPSFDTDDIVMATMVDEWLDTADTQLVNGNSKQKNAALKSLNNSLKKSDCLVGPALSLADIVMWSVVVQSQLSASENVQKWMNTLKGNPLFQTAVKFV